MSQNNRYMSVSVTETKADTKKAKSGIQSSYASAVDASVAALNREFGIYKRENEIEMDELRTKIRAAAKSGGGSGEAGKDGVGIEKVEQTVTSTESGGENKVEVTLTDGKKSEFVVRNGEKGDKGDKGDPGVAENITPESIGAVPIIATYITSANTDFNLDTGTDSFYIIQSSLIPNCPISGQYVFVRQLFFRDATATSSRTQIMYPYGYPNSVMPTNGLAIRVYCNGVWSAWKKFATTDQIPTTADAVGALKRGTYERIQGTAEAHKNLNDYTLPGFYNVKTAYVDNCPTGIGIDAVLLVYPWDNNIYNMQEITETAASPMCRRWTRHSNAGTWTAWKAVITEDSKSLIAPADIGAVSKSGDTMTGAVRVQANDSPYALQMFTEGSGAADIGVVKPDGVYTYLQILPNGAEANSLQYVTNKSGSWKSYALYHAGNKPTAADVGAFAQHGTWNWEGTDLNDFKSFEAIIVTNEKANKPANAGPYATAWNISGVGSGYMIQNYLDVVSMRHYYRGFIDGAWRDWKQIATTDYIDEQILKGEW